MIPATMFPNPNIWIYYKKLIGQTQSLNINFSTPANAATHSWGHLIPIPESDSRARLIDPALHACGWNENLIRCEARWKIVDRQVYKLPQNYVDYISKVKFTSKAHL